jgi:phage terminase Nu1 subunit (DNA packaging protein)
MPAKKKPSELKSEPPAQADLAAALGVTARRVRQLIVDGMPSHSLEAAMAWRKAESTSDSAEALRRARIKLVEAQREKVEIENARLSRELLPEKEVREKIIRVVSAIRSEFTKLPSELPPRISGLAEPAIQRVLRDEIYAVLDRLSDESIAIFEATEEQQ